MQWQNVSDIKAGYHFLFTAVIERALSDLNGIGPICSGTSKKKNRENIEQAMAFILSETCEAYCLELKIDYERIKKEAVGFYQRIIAKTDQITVRKKYTRRAEKYLKRVHVRKVTGKRRITSGR